MSEIRITIPDESAMADLGAAMARVIRAGDRIGLAGDLGAGKTTLTRALLKSLADDPALEVSSPTFTLVHFYDLVVPVRHVDLYRVDDDAAEEELGLGEPDAAEIIEWPRTPLPITVRIDFGATENARIVTVEGPDVWVDALSRARVIHRFVASAGFGKATRTPVKSDASTRRYERLTRPGESAILMDAPVFTPAPDSYALSARLADGNLDAFLAVGAYLCGRGLSVPKARAVDRTEGLLLLEDFGDDKIAVDGQAVEARYAAAVDALVALHTSSDAAQSQETLTGPPPHTPPRFDADLAAVEVALFPQWVLRTEPDAAFLALWREAIDGLSRADDQLALRDFHSPNLLWLPDRPGVAQVGVIDYQDAMIAPAAYDVVSLAQDARVSVPREVQARLVARYLRARPEVDPDTFMTAYHVLGAQRATRVLGVFRRLADRDHKPQYLPHIPRLQRALAENLTAVPQLSPLREWYVRHTDILEGP